MGRTDGERARIDTPPRQSRRGDDLVDGIAQAAATCQGIGEERIKRLLRRRLRGRGWCDDDHELALGGPGLLVMGGERGQHAPAHLLMELGELAADCRRAIAQYGNDVDESRGKPRRRLEQQQRGRHRGEDGEGLLSLCRLGRQEAREEKAVRRKAGERQCRHRCRWAGDRGDGDPRGDRRTYQLVARIGDERRAGVGDEGDARARLEPLDQERPRARRVVLVIGRQRRRDAISGAEAPRDAGILASDKVDTAQGVEGAQGDVAEIADRRRDEMKPRGQPARRLGRSLGGIMRMRPQLWFTSRRAAARLACLRLPCWSHFLSRLATILGSVLGRAPLALAPFLLSLALAACQGANLTEKGPPAQTHPAVVAPPPPAVTEAPLENAPPAENATTPPGLPAGTKVALLLPLSGPNAGLGQALLNAAQLALFDLGDANFELLPGDTKGTAEGAAQAAQAAIGQGAKLILGPFFSAEVGAVAPVAQAAGINVVAFSTDEHVAGHGVFLIGFLPRSQVARVVAYAHAQGLNRFAAVVPDTVYGQTIADLLRQAASNAGAEVTDVELYDPAAKDAADTVRQLAKNSGNFDAVMLPEGGERLIALAPLLPYYDIDTTKIRLLGTGQWDDPHVWREPALLGGWYPAPDPAVRADFEKHYTQLYGSAPPRIATLGYDATALAAVLAKSAGGPNFSAEALTNPDGFAGLDGIFRFRADGLNERGLAILEIQRTGPHVISPAPASFVGE